MTLRGDLRVNHRRIGEWWATRQPGTVDVHHYRWGVRVGSDWMYGELAHREADGAAVLAAKVLAASRAIPDAGGLTEDEIAYAIAGVYSESCGWGATRGRECGTCDCLGMTESYARSAARAVLVRAVSAEDRRCGRAAARDRAPAGRGRSALHLRDVRRRRVDGRRVARAAAAHPHHDGGAPARAPHVRRQ